MFHRETRSKTKQTKQPGYLEHYSVIQHAQKTAKKKKQKNNPTWKLRDHGASSDEDVDDETNFVAALTDNSAYARSLGFPEPFPEYVSHLDEEAVQERLNRGLPVSLWTYLFQPLLKLARIIDSRIV